MLRRFCKYILGNVAGMIGISAYVLADTFFISVAAGTAGITVLNLVLPLYGLIFAIGSMLGVGFATVYALNKTKKDSGVEKYFTKALVWQLIISSLFVALGIICPKLWLIAMGGDGEIIALGERYVRIVLIGTPFFMTNYSFTGFARNDNAPTVAMVAALLASGFNILFDYIFMFPLKMGLSGAALATAMSPLISIIVCSTYIFSRKSTIKIIAIRISFKELLTGVKFGTAAFVGEISSAVTTMVFNFLLLNIAGNIAVAAYGIVANLSLVGMAVFNGVSQGMQPLLSEYYGQGNRQAVRRILKLGISLVIVLEVVLISFTWIFTDEFIAIFNSENNALLYEYARVALRLFFLGYIFCGLNIVLISYFAAIGKIFKASVNSLLRGILAIVFFAVSMSIVFGINGIWLSFLVAELFTFMVVVLMK